MFCRILNEYILVSTGYGNSMNNLFIQYGYFVIGIFWLEYFGCNTLLELMR
jgi:hypothetical protein